MQSQKDYSYGVIPIRYHPTGNREYLVIHQYSPVKGDFYWIFPKGHAEAGETPTESALRELEEETGLRASITIEQTFSLFYSFTVGELIINKEVIFFIGETMKGELTLQPEEVKEVCWCDYTTARHRLTNENSKVLLDQVEEFLNGVR